MHTRNLFALSDSNPMIFYKVCIGEWIMVYTLIKVTAENHDARIGRDKQHPLRGFHAMYSDVLDPEAEAKATSLEKDINRVTHIYVPQANEKAGRYVDVSSQIAHHSTKGLSGKALVKGFLTLDSARAKKLQGLNQDVGNALADSFMGNFRFNTDDRSEPVVGSKISTQNIVKISDSEFRFDFEQIIYFLTPVSGECVYKDLNGELQKCVEQIESATLMPDGSISMTFKGSAESVSCLPIVKMNSSASIKFDQNNNPTVEIDGSVTGYVKEIEYTGPQAGPGIVRVDSKLKPTSVASLAAFSGIETKAIDEGLDIIVGMLKPFSTDVKFMQAMKDYQVNTNKSPIVEMDFYTRFFSKLKKHHKDNNFMMNLINVHEGNILRAKSASERVKILKTMSADVLKMTGENTDLKQKSLNFVKKVKKEWHSLPLFGEGKKKIDLEDKESKGSALQRRNSMSKEKK